MKILLLNSICLFLLGCSSQEGNAAVEVEELNYYALTFQDINSRTISVSAKIPVNGSDLYVLPHDKRFFPDIESWWDIIRIEELSDDSKDPLEIVDFVETDNYNMTKAVLNREVSGMLQLSYSLDISYIDKNYPNLNTAIGKSFEDGYFIVGKPLFIFSEYRIKTKVEINNPFDLKIMIPWEKLEDDYNANSLREFAYSNIILTSEPINTADISIGNLSYSIATFSMKMESTELIKKMATDISNYYFKLFPLNKPVRYVQLIYGVAGQNSGGEAYPYSSSSAISEESMNTSTSWRITVFHELFHMWNSHRLKGVTINRNMEWVTEGFTEFMTEMALYENGHLSEKQLAILRESRLLRLKNSFSRKNGTVSILTSGENKGPNYFIVYEGGWFIANWLNNEFTQKTGNKWDFKRFLAHLFIKYPEDGDIELTLEAFLSEVGAIDEETERNLRIILNSTEWTSLKDFI